jgi:hypothetical protein
MRNLIRASLLVLALSCVTYAGNMPFPAPTPEATSNVASVGNMPFPVSDTQPAPTSDQEPSTVTDIALTLLGSVLSIF